MAIPQHWLVVRYMVDHMHNVTFELLPKEYPRAERTTPGRVSSVCPQWNNHGYDVAKTFGKFSLVSPVWLQVRPTEEGESASGSG